MSAAACGEVSCGGRGGREKERGREDGGGAAEQKKEEEGREEAAATRGHACEGVPVCCGCDCIVFSGWMLMCESI